MRGVARLVGSIVLGLLGGLACAQSPRPTPPQAAAPAVQPQPTSAPTAPASAAPQPSAVRWVTPPLTTLKGDDAIPEPWLSRFRAWLGAQENPNYVAVTETLVVSNALSVVLLRHSEGSGGCLEGPSKLDLIEQESGAELTAVVDHFGDDCCPGTQCMRAPDGWNLRYLSLLAAKDWQQLSLLVPAKKKLTSGVNGEKPSSFSRKDVAAGRFSDAPSCGFMYNVTHCGDVDEKTASFTCHCDGGGYHVNYLWEREGDGFVLVETNESSH